MAGLDMMYDAQGFIQEFIEKKIRELLEDPMNEYQELNWVQAALLFERVVAPCEDYTYDSLYALAQDIVKKAEQNGNMAVYQVIPGMYNEKIINPTSIDVNNLPEGVEVREYKSTVKNIKKWMKTFQDNKIDFTF